MTGKKYRMCFERTYNMLKCRICFENIHIGLCKMMFTKWPTTDKNENVDSLHIPLMNERFRVDAHISIFVICEIWLNNNF